MMRHEARHSGEHDAGHGGPQCQVHRHLIGDALHFEAVTGA